MKSWRPAWYCVTMSMLLEAAYVRFKRIGANVSIPDNQNTYAAADGFAQQGIPVVPFYAQRELEARFGPDNEGFDPSTVAVSGNIGDVHAALRFAGRPTPQPFDYPDHLKPFLGREIEKRTLGWVRALGEGKVFIKPCARAKQFTGCVWDVEDPRPRLGLAAFSDDTEVWVSEFVSFASEARCFVKRDKLIAVKHYAGDWSMLPKASIVEAAVMDGRGNMPAAYALDFGVTDYGSTDLVEANDGYALGCYGLPSIVYARFLEARWAELFGVPSNA